MAGKILKVNVAWLRPLLILDVKRENETGFRKRRNHRMWLMISGQNVVFLDRSEWVSERPDRLWFEGWSRGLESGCLGRNVGSLGSLYVGEGATYTIYQKIGAYKYHNYAPPLWGIVPKCNVGAWT